MTKVDLYTVNTPLREPEDIFHRRLSTAYVLKPIVLNNDEIVYCLADNHGVILDIERVNELFITIRNFYKDVPDVDEWIQKHNKKVFKGEL